MSVVSQKTRFVQYYALNHVTLTFFKTIFRKYFFPDAILLITLGKFSVLCVSNNLRTSLVVVLVLTQDVVYFYDLKINSVAILPFLQADFIHADLAEIFYDKDYHTLYIYDTKNPLKKTNCLFLFTFCQCQLTIKRLKRNRKVLFYLIERSRMLENVIYVCISTA